MKYILQIFSGSWHTADYQPEEIIQTIGGIASRIPVDKVIIGWNTDGSVYRELGAFLHDKGIRMLLWLPVFAETGEVSEAEEALDIFGKRVAPPMQEQGTGFQFGCPSSRRNIRNAEEIYERYFSDCGFDGVFLDRIRSQTFASGVSGVLSCGCDRCRKAFLDRGVDIEEVRKLYERKGDAFFDMASFPMNGEFILKDPAARRFFEAKEEIIADAVKEISRYFRGKGMIVGLDLFAPAVSRFAGQNYALITQYADFIKPMLYRRTEAPAGIGYEYSMFKKSAPKAEGRITLSMDRAFLDAQLETVNRVSCEKYPGTEINYDKETVRTDAAYIAESLAAVRDHGLDGAVLCWNVMSAPKAHIDTVAALGVTDSVIASFVERSRKILGDNLTGIYLHGSAAMGCYNPLKSDLDLIVAVKDSLVDACKRAYMEMVTELSGMMQGEAGHSGIEMSIVRRNVCDPFVYPTPFELHFSTGHLEWYRRDPEEYIQKMKGTDKDLAAHFTVIRNRGKCLYGEPVDAVFGEVPAEAYLDSIREDIAGAKEEIAGNAMYMILNLARVLAYREEGLVLSKREGGEWGLSRLPEEYHPLIRTALKDYGSDAAVRYEAAQAEEYAEYMLSRIAEGKPGDS